MQPLGLSIGSPTPRAALIGSSTTYASLAPAPNVASTTALRSTSVTSAGTEITTRGCTKFPLPLTRLRQYLINSSVMSKFAITPSRRGHIASTPSGTFPDIALASWPTAITSSPLLRGNFLTATAEGSLKTIPLSLT